MNATFLASVLALALLQGALVALPRHGALMRLGGFGSAMWVLALPGLIVIGTFGLVLVPSGAIDLVAFATFASPVLAMLAALAVVRRHLVGAVALLIVGAGVVAVLQRGLVGNIAASLVTAFGAMLVGAAIVRLLPGRTLLAAVAMMCVADVVLMSFGVGQLSSHLMDEATHYFRGPSFDDANIGDVTTEYPDLLLAAVIGAVVAGRPSQRRTALLVVLCVGSYDLLMLVVPTVPATPPLLAALLLAQLPGLPNLRALPRRLRAASRSAFSAFSAPIAAPVSSLSCRGLRAVAPEPGRVMQLEQLGREANPIAANVGQRTAGDQLHDPLLLCREGEDQRLLQRRAGILTHGGDHGPALRRSRGRRRLAHDALAPSRSANVRAR